jgi:hypothetical protein
VSADKSHQHSHWNGYWVANSQPFGSPNFRNPLALQLAGIIFSADPVPAAAVAIRKTILANPVVSELFYYLISICFASEPSLLGIIEKASAHYGVVETNGRRMFHIYSLIHLGRNLLSTSCHHKP